MKNLRIIKSQIYLYMYGSSLCLQDFLLFDLPRRGSSAIRHLSPPVSAQKLQRTVHAAAPRGLDVPRPLLDLERQSTLVLPHPLLLQHLHCLVTVPQQQVVDLLPIMVAGVAVLACARPDEETILKRTMLTSLIFDLSLASEAYF